MAANIITLGRIVLTFFVIILFLGGFYFRITAVLLTILVVYLDSLDGIVARKLGLASGIRRIVRHYRRSHRRAYLLDLLYQCWDCKFLGADHICLSKFFGRYASQCRICERRQDPLWRKKHDAFFIYPFSHSIPF